MESFKSHNQEIKYNLHRMVIVGQDSTRVAKNFCFSIYPYHFAYPQALYLWFIYVYILHLVLIFQILFSFCVLIFIHILVPIQYFSIFWFIQHGGGQVFKTLQWLVKSLNQEKISVGVVIVEDEHKVSRHLKQCALEQGIPLMVTTCLPLIIV